MKDTVASTAPNMDPVRTCRGCGLVVSKDAPFGHCPKCLLALGFIETSNGEPKPKSPAARLRFGDYELIEQIGRGGMGVVYTARQASLNRTVALKMVLDSHLASPVVLRRFLIEAEAAAKLDHPNIVPIYDISEVEGHHFFSMRLIDGESLERKIALGEWEVPKRGKTRFGSRDKMQERIATLIATVARAVHYAHEHGVLHRDLKPSNILIDKQGQPHLTDFGLAKIADNTVALTPATTILGTPGYMPPEQAVGAASQVAGDVYSLGAIFYELLTGKPPFYSPTAMEILRRTKEEEPVSPRRRNGAIDADLVTICLKCLEKDPARRYVSAEAVAEDLERWLRNEPIEARPVRMAGRLRRWCRREPMLAAATLALITLITAVAVLTTVLYQWEKRHRWASERQSAFETSVLMDRIERDGERGGRMLHISAPEISVVTRKRLLIDGSEGRMTICAITPERDPDRMLRPFAELLTDLQNHLRKESRSPVLFDLHLYNRAEDTMDALEGSAHVAWTDAAIYVNARRKGLQLEPVARELYQTGTNLVGLIVTSPESGITNLSSLKGRSFVFGDKGSAVGWYLPRTALVESGLTSSDLSHTDCPIAGVTRLIRSRTYDAGVVLVADFTKLMEAGGRLRVLAELRCPGHPWVFTGNPDATLVNHFRSGLISMRNSSALGRLGSQVVGFVPAKASEYDELEKKIEKAKRFDKP